MVVASETRILNSIDPDRNTIEFSIYFPSGSLALAAKGPIEVESGEKPELTIATDGIYYASQVRAMQGSMLEIGWDHFAVLKALAPLVQGMLPD